MSLQSPSHVTSDAQKPDFKSIRLTGVRILLAEDSPDNQNLFVRILVSAGAIVDVAENGMVAVTKQAMADYDAIIMDMRMPLMDGYEATRRIRSNGYEGSIIALTAHSNPGESERCFEAGCSEFRLKPIDRFGLLDVVDRVVRRFGN